jgi:hypothetical protein
MRDRSSVISAQPQLCCSKKLKPSELGEHIGRCISPWLVWAGPRNPRQRWVANLEETIKSPCSYSYPTGRLVRCCGKALCIKVHRQHPDLTFLVHNFHPSQCPSLSRPSTWPSRSSLFGFSKKSPRRSPWVVQSQVPRVGPSLEIFSMFPPNSSTRYSLDGRRNMVCLEW